jgi:5-methylcytosine-specific restriction protein A
MVNPATEKLIHHQLSIFKEGDRFIWIPVAKKENHGGPTRAFLPFKGLNGYYRYGYKAESSTGQYFNTLRDIQQAFINDEKKDFIVRGKIETQRKARWRHDSSLLAPHRWVPVLLNELERFSKLPNKDLEEALDAAESNFTEVSSNAVEPVLCETSEDLERESARLYREASSEIPSGQIKPALRENSTSQYVRDARIVNYVLREANGTCECCLQSAPFMKSDGRPYLEVHHVKRLKAGGSDRITNAVALCPNCHRELHHGVNSEALAEGLYSKIKRLTRE